MARLEVRGLARADIVDVQALSNAIFGAAGMHEWRRGQLAQQIKRFPDGQLVVELDGRLVASSSAMRIARERLEAPHTWLSISGGGELPNHEPDGDVLYGLELLVAPEARGLGLAQLLYRARKVVARRMGLAAVAMGSRIPGYAEAVRTDAHLGPEAYVEEVVHGKRWDPVLSVQARAGFRPQAVLANYEKDPDSLHYGVLMVWDTQPES